MNLEPLKNSLHNSVWKMAPDNFLSFSERLKEIKLDVYSMTTDTGDDNDDQPNENGTICLYVNGPLVKGTGLDESDCQWLGITDLVYLEEDLREARDNPAVSTIVLVFNSPGGTCHCQSTAMLVQDISQTKDVIGYIDTMACSAAYEIASQCSELFVSSTGWCGFVGTIYTRADYTKMNEQAGVSYTFITSSPKKLYMNSDTTMTEDEKAWIEQSVMYLYEQFKDTVLSNRDIKEEYLDSSIFIGQQAVETNFADGVIVSLDDLAEKIMNKP